MITSDSRYADGTVFLAYNPGKKQYDVSVFRNFPTRTGQFFWYTWQSSDRIDVVAQDLLGDETRWWELMDYNPQVLNPFNIAPGTQIRVPTNA
jgi:hypothetical protein